MPRCCGTITDPADATNVLVFVEVNADDGEEQVNAGLDAAEQAAVAAFAAVNPDQPAPPVNRFTLPGRLTHATVDLTSV